MVPDFGQTPAGYLCMFPEYFQLSEWGRARAGTEVLAQVHMKWWKAQVRRELSPGLSDFIYEAFPRSPVGKNKRMKFLNKIYDLSFLNFHFPWFHKNS